MSGAKFKKSPIPHSNPDTILTPEQQQQFEIELCWCIQQLQTGLKNGKLNKKQIQDHTKALNVLMSNTTPLIKKKQIMRLSFGDYRAKMAADEKKIQKKSTTLKISTAEPSKKSVFIKKSHINLDTDKNFKFNFEIPKSSTDITENLTNISLTDSNNTNNFQFTPSNNTFRFNFNAE